MIKKLSIPFLSWNFRHHIKKQRLEEKARNNLNASKVSFYIAAVHNGVLYIERRSVIGFNPAK